MFSSISDVNGGIETDVSVGNTKTVGVGVGIQFMEKVQDRLKGIRNKRNNDLLLFMAFSISGNQ
jgi:hypothetical protein